MSSDLSWTPYIYEIICKARQKAAWVLSVFYSRSEAIIPALYKSMVRSLLEYCCPLWSPVKIMDIPELESVQKVFTSKISGMSELNYWQRLQKLSLMSLQKRRERYIILHTWKILNKKTSNDLHVQFSLSFVPALEIRQKSLPSRRTRQHFTGLHMNALLQSWALSC